MQTPVYGNDDQLMLAQLLGKQLSDIRMGGWVADGSRLVIMQEKAFIKIGDEYLRVSSMSGEPIELQVVSEVDFDYDLDELGPFCSVSLKYVLLHNLDMNPRITGVSLFYIVGEPDQLHGVLIKTKYAETETLFIETDIVHGLHFGHQYDADIWVDWEKEKNEAYLILDSTPDNTFVARQGTI